MDQSEKIIKPKIKILSIDGGGIRGIIPCIILNYIKRELELPLTSIFDLFAGTSTGGIIALGLTTPDKDKTYNEYEPKDMLDLYVENGPRMFNHRLKEQRTIINKTLLSGAKKIGGLRKKWEGVKKADKLIEEPFNVKNLEFLLKEKFGDTKLSDCIKDVLITSFDIQKNQTVYFLSRTAEGERDKLLRDVARATSAAPTYFKPSRMELEEGQYMGLIDGGVFANNPSILAYCEGKELLKRKDPGDKAITSMEDSPIMPYDEDLPIFMLSIGTGKTHKSIHVSEAENFTTAAWIPHLAESIFMDSVSENTHFTMKHLLPPYKHGQQRYWRLEIENLPLENSDLSNTSKENIDQLIDIAEQWLKDKENIEKLDKIISILKTS